MEPGGTWAGPAPRAVRAVASPARRAPRLPCLRAAAMRVPDLPPSSRRRFRIRPCGPAHNSGVPNPGPGPPPLVPPAAPLLRIGSRGYVGVASERFCSADTQRKVNPEGTGPRGGAVGARGVPGRDQRGSRERGLLRGPKGKGVPQEPAPARTPGQGRRQVHRPAPHSRGPGFAPLPGCTPWETYFRAVSVTVVHAGVPPRVVG